MLNEHHTKKEEAFKKVRDTLEKSFPEVTWLRYQKLQMKTVCDKRPSLFASSREEQNTTQTHMV